MKGNQVLSPSLGLAENHIPVANHSSPTLYSCNTSLVILLIQGVVSWS